jgi:ABC-type multidrug transport system ATPase subunit
MDEAQTCDRLYGMLDGRVEAQGTPEDVLQNESVRSRLALDVPETFELAESLRAHGVPVAQGTSIDRLAESISR